MIIRAAEQMDIDAIVRVENACFSTPWSIDAIKHEICENKLADFTIACDEENNIVGYIGKTILNHVIELTRDMGVKSWYLEVRESNTAAQALYRSAGFSSVGTRKNYYINPVEDAVLMNLEEADA